MTGRWSERKLNQNTKSLREFPTHSAAIRQNRGRMTFVWGFRWLPDEHDGGFLSSFQTRNIFVKKNAPFMKFYWERPEFCLFIKESQYAIVCVFRRIFPFSQNLNVKNFLRLVGIIFHLNMILIVFLLTSLRLWCILSEVKSEVLGDQLILMRHFHRVSFVNCNLYFLFWNSN